MTMLNKFDYSGTDSVCYSDQNCESYKKASEFLGPDQPVEDWGGGTGWAKRYFTGLYKNIDGSTHKNVDEIADLVTYTSKVKNILMRQVLELNPDWQKILGNIKRSFSNKFCLVIGIPFVDGVTRLGPQDSIHNADGSVKEGEYHQEIYFNKQDILDYFPPIEFKVSEEEIITTQYYNKDWVLYVEKTA
jgi:hypothetical protein